MITISHTRGGRWLAPCLLLVGMTTSHSATAFFNSYSALGTNTNEIMEDDSSVPFIDLFKMSLPFREASPLTKGNVQYDRYGWPTRIAPDGQVGTRFVSKLPAGTIPQGYYTVLYEGQGKLEYGNDAKLVEHTEGRDIIMLEPGADKELNATLFIKSTNPDNYLRNVRILPQGGICASNPFQRVAGASQCKGDYLSFEQNSSKIIFNPDYLTYMRDFRVIRFMNMSGITRNPVYAWEDRASIDQQTWGGAEGIRGAPMEVMVELANRLHADPWFSMPHAASDDFIRRFAEYVKANLDPTLKVYVEYTNEAWNGIFNQHAYVKQQGLRLGLDTDPNQAAYKYYSKRSVEIFRIWEQVYGGNEQLVRVLAGLVGSTPMTRTILSYQGAYRYADAYAVAPYVYGDYTALRQARTVNDVFRIMTDAKYPHALPNELKAIRNQADMARSFGVDLIAYEGGQHLVDWTTKTDDQAPNNLFYQANRHPQMGAIYRQLLQGWKDAGGKLFVHYTSPRIYRKFGSFGAKEYITQPDAQAPKHQALLSFVRTQRCWWEGCSGNTLVRHTKPVNTLEAMKTLSEPLDATAPQYQDSQSPAAASGVNPANPVIPPQLTGPAQILAVMRSAPNEQYGMGGNAIVRHARAPTDPWSGAAAFRLRYLIGGQINGASDLAALWQASWDQRNLYIRVGTEDDQFAADSYLPWEDDAIEIYLDADGSGGSQYDQQNDYHLIFSLKDDKMAMGKNSPKNQSLAINHKILHGEHGQVLEISIPWSSLRVQPQPSMLMGLDVHVDDDDDGNDRDGKLAWKARQDDAWRNPSLFGRLMLGD